MTRSTKFETFTIDRIYDAPPARVFAAWASREAKSRWFGDPSNSEYQLDFRIDGRETNRGGPPGGPIYTYEATYKDIVPNERIAFAHTIDADGQRASVCVSTVLFTPEGNGTKLSFTEQGAFFDGLDAVEKRIGGMTFLFESLAKALEA